MDTCLFGRMKDDENKSESGKVFKDIRLVCAGPDCQSICGFHYLKHLKGHSRDLYLRCEENEVFREVLPEEGLWFSEKRRESKVWAL